MIKNAFVNPVIPGFHPDPSVCRAGDDYFLVTSSFEYFPGVPLFHSRDLVHWRQTGHCLTRTSQLNLDKAWSSGGIFACTIRWHDGLFYMITTNVSDGGHFYVTANDPFGAWSDPVRIEGRGFDPDLFWDDDGTVFFTQNSFDGKGIRQARIDLTTGKLLEELRVVWPGFEDDRCEGPHLYKIDGRYYLMVAEGGTHHGHMEVIGRSDRPTGPFEPCPHNPILTHRGKVTQPVQATGHADLIQAADGSWWTVFLGIRPSGWGVHHLGRETFLAPVEWKEGWPVVNGGQPVALSMSVDGLPSHPWPAQPERDDFDGKALVPCWNFRRNPPTGSWSLDERPGWLTLHGTAVSLDDTRPIAWAGRRQQHFDCTAQARMDFAATRENDEAGLAVYMNERHHYEVGVTTVAGARSVFVRRRIGDLSAVTASELTDANPIVLCVKACGDRYDFGYYTAQGELRIIASGLTRYLSSEVATGFTGVYFAMYATGNGKPAADAAGFDWFDYTAG